ncbi:hypothetical protein HN51_007208 [Arachis hypogaea]
MTSCVRSLLSNHSGDKILVEDFEGIAELAIKEVSLLVFGHYIQKLRKIRGAMRNHSSDEIFIKDIEGVAELAIEGVSLLVLGY